MGTTSRTKAASKSSPNQASGASSSSRASALKQPTRHVRLSTATSIPEEDEDEEPRQAKRRIVKYTVFQPPPPFTLADLEEGPSKRAFEWVKAEREVKQQQQGRDTQGVDDGKSIESAITDGTSLVVVGNSRSMARQPPTILPLLQRDASAIDSQRYSYSDDSSFQQTMSTSATQSQWPSQAGSHLLQAMPNFQFDLTKVTSPLSELDRLPIGSPECPLVELLVVIVEHHLYTETRAGKLVCNWVVGDHTGQRVNVKLWDQVAREWSLQTKQGDVVWISRLYLRKEDGAIVATPSTRDRAPQPQLQICWREGDTNEDKAYRWDPTWERSQPKARQVLKLNAWWAGVSGGIKKRGR